MLKKLQIIMPVAILAIVCQFAIAQQTKYRPKEFKFGKIDPAEFEIKPEGRR